MNIPLNDLKKPFMTTLFSNRYVDALVKTIFLFAATHLLILTFVAFRESAHVLNVFKILNLDAFLPWLGQGMLSFVMSYGVAAGVYGLVFFFLTSRNKKTRG
jgi:hypothetical protein